MSQDHEDLQRLLRLKRYEQPPEGYFEDFLHEFQSRQRQELLKRSAHGIFFERVGTYFSGVTQVGKAGWVYGGVGAYAAVMIAMALLPSGETGTNSGSQGIAESTGNLPGTGSAENTLWGGDVSISPVSYTEAPFSRPSPMWRSSTPESIPRPRVILPRSEGFLPMPNDIIRKDF